LLDGDDGNDEERGDENGDLEAASYAFAALVHAA
jgi:hypothetical protein